MTHELRAVSTAADRAAMHAIRRATLFAPDRPGGPVAYDENHPQDLNPANQCFLLLFDEEPIGVVRLDPRGDREGIVRLVGILPEFRGRGHGRALGELIDAEARRRGMEKLALNARQDAVGFYERTGWERETWDRAEQEGLGVHCTQMTKRL